MCFQFGMEGWHCEIYNAIPDVRSRHTERSLGCLSACPWHRETRETAETASSLGAVHVGVRRCTADWNLRKSTDKALCVMTAILYHSSRIRFLSFFENPKNATLYVFWSVMSKNVKKRRKRCPSFHFLHFEIANEHFHCKTITNIIHMSCYTYNIILKLFIFG